MPARAETLEITERYHRAVARLGEEVARLAIGRFDAVDRSNLGESFQRFVPETSRLVALGQDRTAALARGFLRAAGRSELRRPYEPADALEDNAGFTEDGRRLAEGLAATPPQVLLAIKSGRSLDEALAFGRFSVARFARTETIDGARLEMAHQLQNSDGITGWRWRSRGTCAGCMAMDNGDVRSPDDRLPAHPHCQCVQEPVFEVPETVQRETGRERFAALEPKVQDRVLGARRAQLLRAGHVGWEDMFTVRDSHVWREIVTVRAVKELEELAGAA